MTTVFNLMETLIVNFRRNGKIRTAETYTATLKSFRKFREEKDINPALLTSEIMESYEGWLKGRGIAPNTVSFYNRILRAVYNRAVEEGLTVNRNPFRRVYTGIDKTVKRALPIPVLTKIRKIDLSMTPRLEYARDMFLMSFMLRGMSFIDMAFLRKTDLRKGYLTYRRRKTGQQLIIRWTKEMQKLLDKYPENPGPYLLPIIKSSSNNERSAYRNMAYNINYNLKEVARILNIEIPLTLYVARHSWASVAKIKGIPLSVISEGMGHDSEMTTRIYLASLDLSVVDRANDLIIKSI